MNDEELVREALEEFVPCFSSPESMRRYEGILDAFERLRGSFGLCRDAYEAEIACTDALKLRLVEAAKAERSIRDEERKRVLAALIAFLEDDGGTFRKFISILGMDYSAAYDEGWMGFTNALHNYSERIQGVNGMIL